MSRQSSTIQIVVHTPNTSEGRLSLSEQVAAAHAEQVRRYIRHLDLPGECKKQLVDAVLMSHR